MTPQPKPLHLPTATPLNKYNKQSFLKNLIIIFNLLFLLSGLVILGLSVYSFVSLLQYIPIFGGHFDFFILSIYISIATGIIIVFVVFTLGCCAVTKKNKNCLFIFSFFLLFVLLLEISSGTMAYIYQLLMKENLPKLFFSSVVSYSHGNQPLLQAVDQFQQNFSCCGSDSPSDWLKSDWQKTNQINSTLPFSCCWPTSSECSLLKNETFHPKGCARRFSLFIDDHLIVIGGVGLGFSMLQLFGIIISCCLAKKLKKRESL